MDNHTCTQDEMKILKQTQDRLQENNQKLNNMLTEMDQQQVPSYLVHTHLTCNVHINTPDMMLLTLIRGGWSRTHIPEYISTYSFART